MLVCRLRTRAEVDAVLQRCSDGSIVADELLGNVLRDFWCRCAHERGHLAADDEGWALHTG